MSSPKSAEIIEILNQEIVKLEHQICLKRSMLNRVRARCPNAIEDIEKINDEIVKLEEQLQWKRSIFPYFQPLENEGGSVQYGGGRLRATDDQPGPSHRQQLNDDQAIRQPPSHATPQRNFIPSNPPRLSDFVDIDANIDDEPVEEWHLNDAEDMDEEGRTGAELDRQNLDHFFRIDQNEESESVSRNTRTETCKVVIQNIEDARRPDLMMENVIAELFRRVIKDRPAPKYIQLQIQFPEADRPFYVPLRPPEQNTPSVVAAALDHLYRQSGDIFDIKAGPLECKVIAVWPLQTFIGRGACLDDEHRVTRRVRSMVQVRNPGDRFCLAKAIVIGLAARKFLPDREPRYREVCADDAMQTRRAIRLMEQAGVPLDLQFYTIQHARMFQADINEVYGEDAVRIVIFAKEKYNQVLFKGFERRARFNLCLYLEAEHYCYIGQPRQLFGATQYCVDCERSIKRRTFHPKSCVAVCRLCYRFGGPDRPCVPDRTWRRCDICQFTFPNVDCYETHRARGVRGGSSICQLRFMCRRCGAIVYADQMGHLCYRDQLQQAPCRHCGAQHTLEFPYCFIQPLRDEQPNEVAVMERLEEEVGGGEVEVMEQEEREIPMEQEEEEEPPLLEAEIEANVEEEEEGNEEPPLLEAEIGADVVEEEEERNAEKPLRYVWFDIETTQTTRMTVSGQVVRKHVPNLVMADVLCERCIELGIEIGRDHDRRAPNCVCGVNNQYLHIEHFEDNLRRLVFKAFEPEDPNPVDAFLDFLLLNGPRNIRTVAISHNGGKFDTHFCLNRLYQRNLKLKVVTTGLKIYTLCVKGSRIRETVFKDSLNFFLCALEKLPKTFELRHDLVADKPYFPHIYNTLENMDVDNATLPDLCYYEPDKKKPEERKRFLSWYAANAASTPFLLRRDLVEYCANDVAILREACLAFRCLFLEVAQLDPFSRSVTIAGLAMATFRKHDLPPNTLINLPEGGFDKAENQSAIALKFMRLFEIENNCQVQTQQWQAGEARVQDSGYRLDGLWRRGPGRPDLAIEFMGCYFHGCNTCFKDRSVILAGGRTAEELWQRTQRRLRELEYVHRYELCVVWECEFKAELRRDAAIRRHYNAIFIPTPLDPRQDAYRGGRTEPFVFHYRCAADEEIICIDINSLYPNEMKKRAFPTGLPQVLKREGLPMDTLPWHTPEQNSFRGLIKCKILAPSELRYPLLPYRTQNGVLTFPLCAACADQRNQQECNHTIEQRAWVTAYTHAELNKALSLGYVVMDLFEVWNWTDWADMAHHNGLFTNYVNKFLKIKAEASGVPTNCPDKATYARQYKDDEGIELDEERIERNEGLRFISKVMMNSLYGKFGQRPFKTTVNTTTTPQAFHKLLEDETQTTVHIDHVSELMDRVVTRKKAEFCKAPRTTCLPIAIYVTSYARLRLYHYIEAAINLGVKPLYCDTDSIFYVKKVGAPCVPEGDCLGEMKREYEKRKIVKMILAGPKNFAFLHADPENPEADVEAISKIRGFCMNYEASQIINYHRMKGLIFATFNIEEDETLDDIVPPNTLAIESVQFLRTRHSEVYTRRSAKQWKPVYNKGRVVPGMEAVPFGYRPHDAPVIVPEVVDEPIVEDEDDGRPRVPCNIQ